MSSPSSRVTVCKGCCCGKVEKGHPEVPLETLKATWKKHNLREHVELEVSGCLGPCRMHNVSVLTNGDSQIWLGELSEKAHYEAIVEWAINVAFGSGYDELPQTLIQHQFEYPIRE